MTPSTQDREQRAATVLDRLSLARTTPYGVAFQPGSANAQLGCYLWAQALSASVHPFVGMIEVVLRNAIHRSLSLQVSTQRHVSFPWYDRATPGAVPLRGKSLERIEELLSEGSLWKGYPAATPQGPSRRSFSTIRIQSRSTGATRRTGKRSCSGSSGCSS